MVTKVSLFNAALSATGNNPVQDNDGTDEWTVLNDSYPSIVKAAFEDIEPDFGMVFRAPLTSRTDGNERHPDVYQLPGDVLCVRDAYVKDCFWTDWAVAEGKLYIDGDADVEIDYIRQGAEETWSGKFARAIQTFLEAVALRGLNEEAAEADRREASAERQLMMAGVKSAQQRSPARAYQRSRLMSARYSGRRRRLVDLGES